MTLSPIAVDPLVLVSYFLGTFKRGDVEHDKAAIYCESAEVTLVRGELDKKVCERGRAPSRKGRVLIKERTYEMRRAGIDLHAERLLGIPSEFDGEGVCTGDSTPSVIRVANQGQGSKGRSGRKGVKGEAPCCGRAYHAKGPGEMGFKSNEAKNELIGST